MSSPALPSNRDENWRYANLRPLAKARPDAISAALPPAGLALPPPLPGYERWVFIDGQVAPGLSAAAPNPFVSLLDFRDAGRELAQLLDSDLAQAGADFSLARINLQREGKVLHVSVPDGGEARLELNFVATAAASAGTSYPRVQVHAGRGARLRLIERHLSAGATDSASGGSVTVPAGSQQVAVVDTILLPAHRGVAVSAVTEQPAVAAAPPVLLGSCASG